MPHDIYALTRAQKIFLYASEEIAIEAELEEAQKHERERLKNRKK